MTRNSLGAFLKIQCLHERRKVNEEKDALEGELDKMKRAETDELGQREKFYEGACWLVFRALLDFRI